LRTRSAISFGGRENLLYLLVEQQVVVAEMWTADVPMKILGLEVEREAAGQDRVELRRKLAHGFRREVGRSVEGKGLSCDAY
jgi:hypothetical protein